MEEPARPDHAYAVGVTVSVGVTVEVDVDVDVDVGVDVVGVVVFGAVTRLSALVQQQHHSQSEAQRVT